MLIHYCPGREHIPLMLRLTPPGAIASGWSPPSQKVTYKTALKSMGDRFEGFIFKISLLKD
jgi:hypothetical protein